MATDIDECLDGSAVSRDPQCICSNSVGSYTCKCQPGYHLSTNTSTITTATTSSSSSTVTAGPAVAKCIDTDECLTYCTDRSRSCTNTVGSYSCACTQGYQQIGGACVNINECLQSPCSKNAMCADTTPGFLCTCHTGYTGNGKVCVTGKWTF